MVKVSKIAVWDVDGQLIRDAKTAAQRARTIIIEELLDEEKPLLDSRESIASWISDRWDIIEARVERAMAGT